jgi:hypothetical protein
VSPVPLTVTASFPRASSYVNPPAGTYTLTISSSAGPIYTEPVTFAAGEVRTILVYSTAYASDPTTAGNHRIVNTLDNQF